MGRPFEGSDSEPWQGLAEELMPAKSLARTADSAKFLIGTVAVVGGILTGFGVVGADQLRDSQLGSWMSLTALLAVVVALVLALLFLRLRSGEINIQNLVEVRAWYAEQASRAWMVTTAGALLVIAIVAVGVAGGVTVVARQTQGPEIVLMQTRTSATTGTVSGSITCHGCRQGSTYVINLYNHHPTGYSSPPTFPNGDLLLIVDATTGSEGSFTISLPKISINSGDQISLVVDGKSYSLQALP
jgi:hypothetical protein